jgi:hypothetical protein
MAATVQGSYSNYDKWERRDSAGIGQPVPASPTNFGVEPHGFGSTQGVSVVNGTGPNTANEVWSATITFAASTPVTLDLRALSSTYSGFNGRTVQFSKLRRARFINLTSTPGFKVTVGDAATGDEFLFDMPADDDTFAVNPGSEVILENWVDGWPVDSSHKDLKLDPGSNVVVLAVILIGQL